MEWAGLGEPRTGTSSSILSLGRNLTRAEEWSDLLRLMLLLHEAGAVHRDLTPHNVFVVAGGVLKLADFGIAMHRLGTRDVPANAFNPAFVPSEVASQDVRSWRASDDVYQLGQLFAMLPTANASNMVPAKDVAELKCSPDAKAIIERAIGERRKRWSNAQEMLRAFERTDTEACSGARHRRLSRRQSRRVHGSPHDSAPGGVSNRQEDGRPGESEGRFGNGCRDSGWARSRMEGRRQGPEVARRRPRAGARARHRCHDGAGVQAARHS